MLDDARKLGAGTRLEADVIVIGAGAAGIAIALSMANTRTRVLVLESGGLDFERESQDLYRGHIRGLRYEPLDMCRVKGLGGSTGRQGWAGWCKPLVALAFEQRDWVPLSGWPIRRADLAAYYGPAFELLSLPNDTDATAEHPENLENCLPLRDRDVRNETVPLSPAPHLGEVWRDRLDAAGNIRVLLHANVTELETNDRADTITGVRFATLEGATFDARAPIVVLAAGGIENARLLLLSDSAVPGGIGNRTGWVGRCFMDHPRFAWGQITNLPRADFLSRYDPTTASMRLLKTPEAQRGAPMFAASLTLSEAAQRRERILNARSWILPVAPSGERPGGRELREIVLWLTRRRIPSDIGLRMRHVLADMPNAAAAVVAHLRSIAKISTHWQFVTILEGEPNRDSRVTLADDRDRLGLRRVELDWRLGDLTRHTLARTQELIVGELRGLGLEASVVGGGGLAANQTVQDPRWVWHHMGTTRMSARPEDGVVDADCRVHGMDNLYIAGSSVFPTVGNDMPTINLVALAYRLADHLKHKVGRSMAMAD